MEKKYCSECGIENSLEAKFCAGCGSQLKSKTNTENTERNLETVPTMLKDGESFLERGKHEEAIDILTKAKALLDNNFQAFNYCKALVLLSHSMYLFDKDTEVMIGHLSDAVTIAMNEKSQFWIVYSLYIKGLVHGRMSHYFDAQFSLSLADELGEQLNIGQFKKETSKELKKAEQNFKKYPRLEESEAKYSIEKGAESDLRVAKLYMSINQYEVCHRLFLKSLDAFMQLENISAIQTIQDLLANLP